MTRLEGRLAAAPDADSGDGERPAIETRGLTKRFRRVTALSDCSITVPPGRICALVGPNGAGKTTLLRMLAGLARPTGGTAAVLGRAPRQDRAFLAEIGYLAQRQRAAAHRLRHAGHRAGRLRAVRDGARHRGGRAAAPDRARHRRDPDRVHRGTGAGRRDPPAALPERDHHVLQRGGQLDAAGRRLGAGSGVVNKSAATRDAARGTAPSRRAGSGDRSAGRVPGRGILAVEGPVQL